MNMNIYGDNYLSRQYFDKFVINNILSYHIHISIRCLASFCGCKCSICLELRWNCDDRRSTSHAPPEPFLQSRIAQKSPWTHQIWKAARFQKQPFTDCLTANGCLQLENRLDTCQVVHPQVHKNWHFKTIDIWIIMLQYRYRAYTGKEREEKEYTYIK